MAAIQLIGIVALVYCSCVTVVWADYTLQVAVLEYTHLDSKLWDGRCCNLNCSGSCNSTFHFCLLEGKCTASDGCPCTLGLITTDHSPLSAGYVTFSIGDKVVDNISNPINFEVTQWKGTLKMKIEIKNKAGVDRYNLIDEVNVNEELKIGEPLSRPVYYGGTYDHVRLRLSFRVLCNQDCATSSANCSTNCNSNIDGHPALEVIGTFGHCLQTTIDSTVDCGVPSTLLRTIRAIPGSNAAKTIGNNFYIGFMQNYVKPRFSNFKLNKSLVFIATDSSRNMEVIIKSHNELITMPIAKHSSVLSHDHITFKNRRIQNTSSRFQAIQMEMRSGHNMALFVINEEYTSVDGYTALPCNSVPATHEYHYYAVSVPRTRQDTTSPTMNSAFLIIACVNHTSIIITPARTVTHPLKPSESLAAGQSHRIILNELEILYLTSPNDLTGSHVITDKPISLISGHECGSVPFDRDDCNHLVEQIPPTAVWGKKFFISAISDHPSGDIFKIVASSNRTAVNFLCTNAKRELSKDINVLISDAGASLNVSIQPSDNCIVTSENRILVVQFALLGSSTTMIIVPATHQYLNTHWFTNVYAGDVKYKHYMKVFVSHKDFNPSLIRLNGETISAAWKEILCRERTQCGYVGVVSLTDGAHIVSHDNPAASIGVIIYGVGNYESYGYVGGMLLAPLINTDDLNVAIVHPKITSFVINVGKHMCFECITKPSTPEAHQFISWSVNTVIPGAETSRLPNGTLCINEVTAGHTGTYRCRAGTDSLTYTLSVVVGIIVATPPPPPSPDIATIGIGIKQRTYVDSTEKSYIHIYCPLEGLEDTPTWSANGAVIHPGIRYVITREYLRVQKPLASGCTTYNCKITFASYTYEESSTVCVRDFYAPKNLTISGPSKVIEGKRFYLDCKAKAYPEAEITWSTKSGDLPKNGVTNYGNGTIKLRLLEGNETTYCCTAANSKQPPARKCTTITLILLPHIMKTRLMRRPGDCKDVTREKQVSELVGMNLCYHISSTVYLNCVVDRGNPKPNITWFKDGSSLPKGVALLRNGTTLLFQNTTMDLQAAVDGHPNIGGNYTCVATNPSGKTAASSVITPFGDISQKILQRHLMPVQKQLYQRIHAAITKSISQMPADHKHVVLLRTAKPLLFEDFNPGKLFDGSEKSVAPQIMENMFNLVDIIPKSLPLLQETWPLYRTYQNLINKLVPIRSRTSAKDFENATHYLKELVVDLDNEGRNTTIPRLSLYLRYKNSYHTKDLQVRREMELQLNKLSNEDYSDWYASKGVLLESERSDLYLKWETMGDKTGVEKRLEMLDLQDHAKPLNDVKAILEASKKSLVLQSDQQFLPVQFLPSNWYQLYLPKRIDETSDQINYYHATLKSKLLVLEQAKMYLRSESDLQYKLAPKGLLDIAERTLSDEVKNSEQQRYQCIKTRGPLECQLYSVEVASVMHLMDQYTEAFWAAEQYKHATSIDAMLEAIQDSIKAVKKKMVNLAMIANIKTIQATSKQFYDHNDLANENDNDITFVFNSTTKLKTVSNVDFPLVERLLWYMSSDSAEEYNSTINYLNSASVKVHIRLVKVDILRRWMKPEVFSDKQFQMGKSNWISPGPLPLMMFAHLMKKNMYQLPLYPSAFVLATNIQISIKVPVPFHLMRSLLKMSYDPTFSGGFGPFVIGHRLFPGEFANVAFLVEQRDADILMTLPGSQLVGYVCSVVPKSPPSDILKSFERSTYMEENHSTSLDQGSKVRNETLDG